MTTIRDRDRQAGTRTTRRTPGSDHALLNGIGVGALTSGFGAVQAALGHDAWPGIVVGVLGAFSAATAALAQERRAQRAYLDNRTKAERLRAAAFTYLAEPPPFSDTDRQAKLAQAVADVAQGKEPE